MRRKVICLILAITIAVLSGCYGSFTLTRKVYEWNGSLGDKYVESAIFWMFVILPVYEATTFIDAVVLNTIEFWLGSNPLAISEDQRIRKTIRSDEKTYEITTGHNELLIQEVSGPEAGEQVRVVYDEANHTWLLKSSEGTKKIASLEFGDEALAKLFYPDGKEETKRIAEYSK